MGVLLRDKPRLTKEKELYNEIRAEHKSLAMAGEEDKVFVLGYSSCEATSADMAIAEALADCDKRRRDRRIEAPCRTIAVGDIELP